MTPSARVGDLRRGMLLAALAFLVYNANFRVVSAGDCYPSRFIPFALWGSGTVTLEPVADVARVDRENPFWMARSRTGVRISMYPIVAPILVSPLYGPAVAVLRASGWRTSDLILIAEAMEKIAASTVAALTVGLAYLLFSRGVPRREATWLAFALAFGTSTWVTGSQALWQHGIGELLVVVALLLVTGGAQTRSRLFALGVTCGLIVANRPPDAILALSFGVIVLLQARLRSWVALAGAVAGYAPFAVYDWIHFSNVGGGYAAALRSHGGNVGRFFGGEIASGIAGLLVSPGKGLLVFSPFLLFLVLLARRSVRERLDPTLALPLAAGVAAQIALYAKWHWTGGASYGPRFLTEMLPILLWLLAPVLPTLRDPGRTAFATLFLWAVFCQAAGAFCYPKGGSDGRDPWVVRDAPMLVEARAGLAPSKLTAALRRLGLSLL